MVNHSLLMDMNGILSVDCVDHVVGDNNHLNGNMNGIENRNVVEEEEVGLKWELALVEQLELELELPLVVAVGH